MKIFVSDYNNDDEKLCRKVFCEFQVRQNSEPDRNNSSI
jgi:hypothetical protein